MRLDPPSVRRSLGFWPVLVMLLLVSPTRVLAVARSCGPDALANTQNVLCASGSCSATLVRVTTPIEVTAGGCDFDLGGRNLSFERTFQMTGLGFIQVVNAGDITLTSNGKLKARGNFVDPNVITRGGTISLTSTGMIESIGSIKGLLG